jgi:hypothetical protein
MMMYCGAFFVFFLSEMTIHIDCVEMASDSSFFYFHYTAMREKGARLLMLMMLTRGPLPHDSPTSRTCQILLLDVM